jgi:hypothetical protein
MADHEVHRSRRIMNDPDRATLPPPAAEAPGILLAAAAAAAAVLTVCIVLWLDVLAAVVKHRTAALVAVVVAMQREVHLQIKYDTGTASKTLLMQVWRAAAYATHIGRRRPCQLSFQRSTFSAAARKRCAPADAS